MVLSPFVAPSRVISPSLWLSAERLYFNAALTVQLALAEYRYVRLYIDKEDTTRFAFSLHTQQVAGALKLQPRPYGAFIISTCSFRPNAGLATGRYLPTFDAKCGVWICEHEQEELQP